jgi:hypothetical protein
MSDPKMLLEKIFELLNVGVTVLAPSIRCGIRGIPHLKFRNGRLGVQNARLR